MNHAHILHMLCLLLIYSISTLYLQHVEHILYPSAYTCSLQLQNKSNTYLCDHSWAMLTVCCNIDNGGVIDVLQICYRYAVDMLQACCRYVVDTMSECCRYVVDTLQTHCRHTVYTQITHNACLMYICCEYNIK